MYVCMCIYVPPSYHWTYANSAAVRMNFRHIQHVRVVNMQIAVHVLGLTCMSRALLVFLSSLMLSFLQFIVPSLIFVFRIFPRFILKFPLAWRLTVCRWSVFTAVGHCSHGNSASFMSYRKVENLPGAITYDSSVRNKLRSLLTTFPSSV
jgi:hypothetical protein